MDAFKAFLAKSLAEPLPASDVYYLFPKGNNEVELVCGSGTVKQKIATIEFLDHDSRGEMKRREIFLGHLTDRLNNPELVSKPEQHPWFSNTNEIETQASFQIHVGRQDTSGNYHPFAIFVCKDADQLKYKDAVDSAIYDLGHTLAGIAARRRASSRPDAGPDELNT